MANLTLTGTETLFVLPTNATTGQSSPITGQTTTGAIAALANLESAPFIVTNITTVGNGTLTAAGLVGGEIVRTGPVAAFSDATDTAANIIAALPGVVVGSSFNILIKNATAYTQTITAGTGVTLPNTVITPPFAVNNYVATVSTASTLTLVHIDTTAISVGANATAPSSTSIATVGAGTLTAAGFVGGMISRGGSQSGTPFTDTTDTAANIIAAAANLVNKIGTSMYVVYSNGTNAVATLTGGTGVTVSGITAVPAGMAAVYLLTYTAAATMTMVGVSLSSNLSTVLALAGSSSGQTLLQPTAAASGTLTLPAATDTLVGKATTDTLTNKTLTAPTVTGPILGSDIHRSSASITANGTITYADVTGLLQTVVAGTYRFRCVLPSTVASGTGGIKYAFHYVTTALTSIEATGIGFTASAVAVQHTTTTTDVADLFSQAAVVIMTLIEGTMVVSTGGTIQLQMAQNTSNASNSITLIGSSMAFDRIA